MSSRPRPAETVRARPNSTGGISASDANRRQFEGPLAPAEDMPPVRPVAIERRSTPSNGPKHTASRRHTFGNQTFGTRAGLERASDGPAPALPELTDVDSPPSREASTPLSPVAVRDESRGGLLKLLVVIGLMSGGVLFTINKVTEEVDKRIDQITSGTNSMTFSGVCVSGKIRGPLSGENEVYIELDSRDYSGVARLPILKNMGIGEVELRRELVSALIEKLDIEGCP
ncbi:hypothetical protein KA119_00590 [Candidatus Gracilibacteria bacterium]|nr:hypothetical protein [Candidatus Gracilibacteria bacterium]